jgi:cell division protein FtsW
LQAKKGHIDWYIVLSVLSLMLFSIAFVYSASAAISQLRFGSSENLFLRHTLRVAFAIIAMIIFSRIDYHLWMRFSKSILVISITLLIVVLFSGKVNEVNRWINLGPLSFQPSELAKFAMVIHFSALLSFKQSIIKDFNNGFVPFALWTLIICILIALQPNFSTAMVIFIISVGLLFIGNVNLLYILSSLIFITASAFAYVYMTAGYKLSRITAFVSNSQGLDDSVNYQLNQALIAIGNGGFFGVGPGQSRQSHLFLPESYGDFIISIIGEEYGFIGIVLILAAFIMIFWRGLMIARKAPDNFGYFLSSGIILTFALYTLVNVGVNTGILPTTGLPMPFISYGGTAVIIYGAAIGILLNISSQAGVYPLSKEEKTKSAGAEEKNNNEQ